MKVKTYQFGEIEFDDSMIIKFENGIFGFEQLKNFLLIKPEDDIFYWLNSVEQPDLAFPLIGARIIDEKYPEVKNHEAFGIVTLNKDPLLITINLKAPILINQDAKSGFQKIIDNEKYPVNYNLFTD